MDKRIVITGIGVVSPIGIGKDAYWQALREGKSGIRPITLFDTSDFNVKDGGEITDFDAKEILGKRGLLDLDRATKLLLCASHFAIEDAKLEITDQNTKQIGVSTGTTFGSLYSISSFNQGAMRDGPKFVNPSVFPSTVGNSASSRVGIRFKIKGFNATLSTGMGASLDALDYARDFINLEKARSVLVGSVEALAIQIFLGFHKLGYLSGLKTGRAVSRPFDQNRDGIVISEGSSMLVVEDVVSANERNAGIYAEILGTGSCFDPFKLYRYNPKGDGMQRAMKIALDNAGLNPQDIDCIFANANSTKDADEIEAKAIEKVFGKYGENVPITAVKSMVGETWSASGGLSMVAALNSLKEGIVPPVINCEKQDPACGLNLVLNKQLSKKLSKIMINTFDPNGNNSVVIIGKWQS